ncbi:MAG TPA: hypothetical protein VK399_07480 [Longimicrobiaceae bacterium]|nr:hypothetical protein [Longimicrobiaceae bacterium]
MSDLGPPFDAELSRRDFVRLLGLSPFTLGLFHTSPESAYCSETLRQEVPEGAAMRRPLETGLLDAHEKQHLHRAFGYLRKKWEMEAHCVLTQADFHDILDLKTSRPPSYLAEYRETSVLLQCLTDEFGGFERAAEQLLYFDPNDREFAKKRIGHIHYFVVREFLNLLVTQGGFRRFGYVNYAGWRGGRYDDPSHLPYRPYLPASHG